MESVNPYAEFASLLKKNISNESRNHADESKAMFGTITPTGLMLDGVGTEIKNYVSMTLIDYIIGTRVLVLPVGNKFVVVGKVYGV